MLGARVLLGEAMVVRVAVVLALHFEAVMERVMAFWALLGGVVEVRTLLETAVNSLGDDSSAHTSEGRHVEGDESQGALRKSATRRVALVWLLPAARLPLVEALI